MKEYLRQHLYTRMDQEEAERHERRLAYLQELFQKRLGFDPGPLACMAYYFQQEHRLLDFPVLIDRRDLHELQQNALVDDLSGLGNRRLFNLALAKEFANARRNGPGFSLILLDIDHFKRFNDAYGHIEGDQAIMELAEILRSHSRDADFCLRFGGEEFALILPRTAMDQALLLAERLRKTVETHSFNGKGLTVSAGIATYAKSDMSCRDVLERADKALYRAKCLSRNTVCTHWADNRSSPRFKIAIPVELCVPSGRVRKTLAESVNISRGGLLVESAIRPDIGARHSLRLYDTANGNTIELQGKVRKASRNPRQSTFIAYNFLLQSDASRFEEFFTCLVFKNDWSRFFRNSGRQPASSQRPDS